MVDDDEDIASGSSSVSDETKLLVKQGKLIDIVLKHVGILIAKVESVEDKLDESLKCTIETASAADDLKMGLTLLAEGQSYMIEADKDSVATSATGSVAGSPGQHVPAVTPKMTYASMFTGIGDGSAMWGVKIGTVCFRLLTTNPYPTEIELLESLLEQRKGIPAGNVKVWFHAHRQRIRTAFRDKRSSYMRNVRHQISQVMQVEYNKEHTKEWRVQCSASWNLLKEDAEKGGLLYPTEVTDIAFSIALLWDKMGGYTTELLPYERPGAPAEVDDCSRTSIVTLEALTLLCCEITFCYVESQLSAATCGTEFLDQAVQCVLEQRMIVELKAAEASVDAANGRSDSD